MNLRFFVLSVCVLYKQIQAWPCLEIAPKPHVSPWTWRCRSRKSAWAKAGATLPGAAWDLWHP